MEIKAGSPLVVRPLEKGDALSVAKLHEAVFRELGVPPVHSAESVVKMFETDWLDGGAGLTMWNGDELAGYGWARHPGRWVGRDAVHVGLFLCPECRPRAAHRALTDPLLELTRELGVAHGSNEAVVFYRSIDTIHPPVVRELGFAESPVSLLGFRHDLRSPAKVVAPARVTVRPLRLPDELPLLEALSSSAFDDRSRQGESISDSYLKFEATLPGFSPEQFAIAEAEHRAVGYAILLVARAEPGLTYELAEIGVIPEWRGRSVGTALLSEVLLWARTRGASALLTAAYSTNRVGTLYWRMGFRPDAVRTFKFYVRALEAPGAGVRRH